MFCLVGSTPMLSKYLSLQQSRSLQVAGGHFAERLPCSVRVVLEAHRLHCELSFTQHRISVIQWTLSLQGQRLMQGGILMVMVVAVTGRQTRRK